MFPSSDEFLPKYKLGVETYPLPTTVDKILSLFTDILLRGQVQKVVFTIKQPVYVERMVPEGIDGEKDLEGVSIENILRSIETILELPILDTPLNTLAGAVTTIIDSELFPIALIAGDMQAFCSWSSINIGIFGLPPPIEDKSLPGDVFVLCGAQAKTAKLHHAKVAVKIVLPQYVSEESGSMWHSSKEKE